jgi:hypothetical protein
MSAIILRDNLFSSDFRRSMFVTTTPKYSSYINSFTQSCRSSLRSSQQIFTMVSWVEPPLSPQSNTLSSLCSTTSLANISVWLSWPIKTLGLALATLSSTSLNQMFVVANPSLNDPNTTHNMPFRLRSNTSNLEWHLFGFLIVFGDLVHPATAEQQLWSLAPNCSAKNASIRVVVDASSHRANVFITVAAIICTSTTLKMTWDAGH